MAQLSTSNIPPADLRSIPNDIFSRASTSTSTSVSVSPSTTDLNSPSPSPSPFSFSLKAPPGTDIYASPPPNVRHVFSAPILYKRLPRKTFRSAQVTVQAAWSLDFDQGGLIFVIPSRAAPEPDARCASTEETHPRWIKAGIEVNDADGRVCVSVVARGGGGGGGWCDWSLVPLTHAGTGPLMVPAPLSLKGNSSDGGGGGGSTGLEVEGTEKGSSTVAGDETGNGIVPVPVPVPVPVKVTVTVCMTRSNNALMVWMLDGQGHGEGRARTLIRKVPWVFLDGGDGDEDKHVLVGVYAARPDPKGEATRNQETLVVSFDGFDIQTL